MKNCTQCGASLEDDAKFCTNCGAKVTEKQNVNNTEQVTPKPKKFNGNGKKINLAVIAIVAAMGVVIVGTVVFQMVIKPSMDQASDYKQAVAYASSGDYEQAANVFDYLGDYKDSEQKWAESKMEQAKKYMKAESDFDTNFSNAKTLLEEVEKRQSVLTEDGKRKFTNLKEQCENYETAVHYIDTHSYYSARSLLQKMDSCPAVTEVLETCNSAIDETKSSSNYAAYNDYDDYDEDYDDDYDDDYEDYEDEESSDFILPNSSDEYLTASDVEDLSSRELSIARNEIYARHGRLFESEKLQDYFDDMDWYDGRYEDVTDDELSQIEKDNIKLIQEYEAENGGSYSWK